MRHLDYTVIASPTAAQLAAFKGYIGQGGSAADETLSLILKESLLKVGEMADVSLLSATCVLSVSDYQGEVHLYGTPDTIISVKDNAGNDIEYTYHPASKAVIPGVKADEMVITYTTKVVSSSFSFIPKAWDYGKARYDGADAATLGQILNSR